VLRLAWYTANSIRRFDSKTNRTADSIRDSIQTKKNDSQVPKSDLQTSREWCTGDSCSQQWKWVCRIWPTGILL